MKTARSIATRGALGAWLALALMISAAAPGAFASAPANTTQNYGGLTTDQGLASSTAVVAHSGTGVNLRAQPDHAAQILTTVPEGASVTLRVDQVDTVYDPDGVTRWWPVSYKGQDGWIAGFYLAPPSASSTSTSTATSSTNTSNAKNVSGGGLSEDQLTGNSVKVANSANGVNLRAKPDSSAKVLDKLPEDTVVTLRIDQVDTVWSNDGIHWWPVSFNGQDGWIDGQYLVPVTSSASPVPSASPSSSASPNATSGGLTEDQLTGNSVVVANSANGVNLRAKPDGSANVLDKLPEDTVVSLRIDQVNTVYDSSGIHWWPVSYNGQDGWIDGQYLAPSSQSASPSPSPASQAKFTSGEYVAAKTPSGRGVVIRAEPAPDADKVGSIAEGDVVQIMGGPTYDDQGDAWYKVTNGSVTGYSDGSLFVQAPQPSPPPSQSPQPSPSPSAAPSASIAPTVTKEPANFSVGDYAQAKTQLGIGVNIHANPSITSTVVGTVVETGIVQIEDGPIYDSQGNVWYKVTSNGATGYVNGTLFVAASAPAPSPSPTPAPSQQPAAQPAPAASSSQFIYPLANYTLTQGYGCTSLSLEPWNAALGCYFHNAIDLAAPQGTPIMAAAAGTVVTAGWCDCGLGYMVEIDHGTGFHTVYGHMMQQPSVSVGQQVSQGEVIGYVGSTGDSTGPHTHFEILLNGNTVNPLDYLP